MSTYKLYSFNCYITLELFEELIRAELPRVRKKGMAHYYIVALFTCDNAIYLWLDARYLTRYFLDSVIKEVGKH